MRTVLNGYLVLFRAFEPNPNWTQPGQLLAVKRTRSSIDKTVVSFQRYEIITPTQVYNFLVRWLRSWRTFSIWPNIWSFDEQFKRNWFHRKQDLGRSSLNQYWKWIIKMLRNTNDYVTKSFYCSKTIIQSKNRRVIRSNKMYKLVINLLRNNISYIIT